MGDKEPTLKEIFPLSIRTENRAESAIQRFRFNFSPFFINRSNRSTIFLKFFTTMRYNDSPITRSKRKKERKKGKTNRKRFDDFAGSGNSGLRIRIQSVEIRCAASRYAVQLETTRAHVPEVIPADQWQPQLFTTMFLYFFSITLLSSRKYSTEIGESLVGAQQGFGTLPGLTRCTRVWTIA